MELWQGRPFLATDLVVFMVSQEDLAGIRESGTGPARVGGQDPGGAAGLSEQMVRSRIAGWI